MERPLRAERAPLPGGQVKHQQAAGGLQQPGQPGPGGGQLWASLPLQDAGLLLPGQPPQATRPPGRLLPVHQELPERPDQQADGPDVRPPVSLPDSPLPKDR